MPVSKIKKIKKPRKRKRQLSKLDPLSQQNIYQIDSQPTKDDEDSDSDEIASVFNHNKPSNDKES